MKNLFLILFPLFLCFYLHAGTITVTSNADSGTGTLRNAISAANSGDTIDFALSYPDSIVVSNRLTINKNLTIIGPGEDLLSISGGGANTVFFLQAGSSLYMSGLSIVNGSTNNAGGGILNLGSQLTLEYCTISHNKADEGGGLANLSSLGSPAHMILRYCKVVQNQVVGSGYSVGGAILSRADRGDSSILEIDHCLIAENQYIGSGAGGGMVIMTSEQGGASLPGVNHCFITNSAITNNSVISSNSYAFGGGLLLVPDFENKGTLVLKMENCTVSGNQAISTASNGSARAGGISANVGSSPPEDTDITVEISHSTITKNTASGQGQSWAGGVLFGVMGSLGSKLNLNHNIIAGNHAIGPDTVGVDIWGWGGANLNGYNLVGNTWEVFGTQSTDVLGITDAGLCPLADNGGFTPTHALATGSIAIDAGDPASTLTVDQRDSARLGTVDIGAYEYNPSVSTDYDLAGKITQSTGAALANTKVYLITYNDTDTSLTAIDSSTTDGSGAYQFSGTSAGDLYLKATPDSATYPSEIPTYYENSLVFQSATAIGGECGSLTLDFSTIAGTNPGGPGFIGGLISQGANKMGEALAGITLLLVDSTTKQVHDITQTDATGNFQFGNLALGTYEIWVDRAFIDNDAAPVITLSAQQPTLNDLSFELHSTYLEWLQGVGIDKDDFWKGNIFTLYPNPAKDRLMLEWKDQQLHVETELSIYSLNGQLLKTVAISPTGQTNFTIDLSAGMYMYKITQEGIVKAAGKFGVY